MTTRQRPGDRGAEDSRRLLTAAARELRLARRAAGMSIAEAARRAGISPSRLGRLERLELRSPGFESVCRAARAVGLNPAFRLFPTGEPIVGGPQQGVLARLEHLLGRPLVMTREVGLPIAGDRRAWDARVADGSARASIDAESRLDDIQAVARRIALKRRDDPDGGVVLLVLNRTAHNRAVLQEHRESLRAQFPLDGAAVLRALRAGRIPVASGILLV